ncbi:MAG TPA: hypothetical protein VD886_10495, partial [Herpetosiphonaceae bacterium]|nr:hypothetical protein [Herpetosiphonaceae bacterium]
MNSPATPEMRVELLGPVALCLGDERLPLNAWGKRKARLLLLMLLTSPDSRVSRADLASLLWPALAPEDLANNLYTTLHALRQFLASLPPPAWSVQLGADVVTLELPAEVRVDWREFIAQAGAAARAPADVARALAALDLYRGPLNPDPALDE